MSLEFSKLALSPLQELSAETDERSSPQPKAYPSLIALARRNWRTCAALLAMLADVGILTLSFFAAALLQYPTMGLGEIVSSHIKFYLFFVGVFLCLFTSMGIYRTVSYTPLKRHFFAATKAYVYGAAIILSSLFLFGNTFYSRPFLMTLFTLMVAMYWMVWLMLRQVFRVLRKRGYGQWSTLVVGPAANVEKLLDRFEDYPDLGYDPIRPFRTSLRHRNDGKLHVNTADIEHEILRHRSEVLVLTSPDLNGSYDELEGVCRKHRVRMRVVSPETDALYSQVRIHDIAGLPLFSPERRRLDAVKRIVKRAFDLVAALFLLVVTSPVFLLVAIATRLESHGPVFFKQKRALSDRDRPFVFYKFRSMHHEADEKKASLFPLNESNGASVYVSVGTVHMVMEAFDDPSFRTVVNNSAIVTPDGMPLVWGLRLLGLKDAQRVYGPTLSPIICEKAAQIKIPVGFYGGTQEVISRMIKNLKTKFPSLEIAYAYSPPFHELSEEEDRQIVADIIASGTRILFVGLGCPKQERWMARHVNLIPAVMVGVGAAFDFIAGTKPQAPPWLQNLGLEWFFRLITEPKRLWKRYLYHNPRFVLLFAKQLLYQRHSETTEP